MKTGSIQALLVSMLVVGCAVDRGGNPGYGCTSDADCDAGVCYNGFCIAAMDAGACAPEDACYTGPEGTRDVGVCRAGCSVATDGASVCAGEVQPTEEQCNTLDDDCDGMVDETFALDATDQCGACTTQCAVGEDCCATSDGHECANLSSSADHCGACGTRCDSGQACCGAEGCVDIANDPSNCGACGNACGAGQLCCAGTCVNPRSSNDHCGVCGNACAGDASSTCCPSASGESADCRPMDDCATCPDCGGVDDLCCGGECIDKSTDNLNCGACGVACGADERCCGGTCVSLQDACSACGDSCGSAGLCCGEECVANDRMHCGACGTSCTEEQECCPSGCTNLLTNPANCGRCDNTCGDGEMCSNGHCCAMGTTYCANAGACVELTTNDHCGSCTTSCGGGCHCAAGGGSYRCTNLLGGLGC